MQSSVSSAYAEMPAMGGEAARLRAALGRQAARRAPRPTTVPLTETVPVAPAPTVYDLAAVRQRAWLLPKEPFVAVWRLLVGLAGIAAILGIALLLDAGIATVQLSFQGR